jgi:hypothetical protein
VFEQLRGDGVPIDDGVAPVIEGDEGDHLGQQLGAEAVRIAGDRG